MKEKKLKIIISLMSFALIGLIAVQIYWIKNAIELEAKLFDYNVIKSLNSVVETISQNESTEYVVHNLVKPKNEDIIFIKNDTLSNRDYVIKSREKWVSRYNYNLNNSDVEINLESIDENDSSKLIVEYSSYDDVHKLRTTGRRIITLTQLDSIKLKKKLFVNEVVDNLLLIGNTRNIEERIKEKELFNYIKLNLNNNGISTDFLFAVKSEERDSLFFIKDNDQAGELNKTTYSAQLFPEELFHSPDHLLVYFPGRTEYLLRSASLVLILSALLILTIIFLYYKTVKILIRQKRLVDIKSDLINNITHEFKTPISTISLASEALQEKGLINNKNSIDKYAVMIREESIRLKKMVDSLLNTAFIENGKFSLIRSELDVHSIIYEIVEKNKLRAKHDEDEIKTELRAEKFFINGDKLHLTNILDNVIDNAIKYSGDLVWVKIETENAGNGIIINVTDKGIGIEKHQQEKIFDSFYRVQKGNIHNTRGYGIGLSYVKKLVEAHDGRISVKSKPGEGTTFSVFLPYE